MPGCSTRADCRGGRRRSRRRRSNTRTCDFSRAISRPIACASWVNSRVEGRSRDSGNGSNKSMSRCGPCAGLPRDARPASSTDSVSARPDSTRIPPRSAECHLLHAVRRREATTACRRVSKDGASVPICRDGDASSYHTARHLLRHSMKRALENRLGFLIGDIARRYGVIYDRRAKQEIELTRAQCRLIVYLSAYGELRQTDLAMFADVSPMTVARMVDRMETAGWVRRQTDPADRRAFRVSITDKADDRLDAALLLGDDLTSKMTEGFSQDEVDTLLSMLKRMRVNLASFNEARGGASGEDDATQRADADDR
ncbi:MarR family transcriptional regulator [Pararobbsia silviterrae]|uniref:MarR family transcriptional regulator n=2 Tax=Pararobbsia silviterrae TaxID=1792498 RepID=A0A494XYJ4_9BURK|nr:MarR family transcriptional regulator [Pararobbsia silviterrae]